MEINPAVVKIIKENLAQRGIGKEQIDEKSVQASLQEPQVVEAIQKVGQNAEALRNGHISKVLALVKNPEDLEAGPAASGTPPAGGTQQPPPLDGTQEPPAGGTQQPPPLDGTQEPPDGKGKGGSGGVWKNWGTWITGALGLLALLGSIFTSEEGRGKGLFAGIGGLLLGLFAAKQFSLADLLFSKDEAKTPEAPAVPEAEQPKS